MRRRPNVNSICVCGGRRLGAPSNKVSLIAELSGAGEAERERGAQLASIGEGVLRGPPTVGTDRSRSRAGRLAAA